jgi:hypothetical protein
MTSDDERALMRALMREVTLTLLAVFEMYGADLAVVTATARSMADVFRARLSELERPRRRGRAALRALLRQLEP